MYVEELTIPHTEFLSRAKIRSSRADLSTWNMRAGLYSAHHTACRMREGARRGYGGPAWEPTGGDMRAARSSHTPG